MVNFELLINKNCTSWFYNEQNFNFIGIYKFESHLFFIIFNSTDNQVVLRVKIFNSLVCN